jgi:hypothetical protein
MFCLPLCAANMSCESTTYLRSWNKYVAPQHLALQIQNLPLVYFDPKDPLPHWEKLATGLQYKEPLAIIQGVIYK